jgi:protein-disulfide isomerase
VGLAAVFYLGYASFFVLKKLCPICTAIYISVIGIFLASSSASAQSLASLPGRLMRDLRTVFMQPVAATLAVLWLVGSVSLIAFFPRETPPAAQQSAATAPVAEEAIDPGELANWHAWLDQAPRVPEMAPSGDVKVLLIKFNDYQCPSCRLTWTAYADVIASMEAKYPGRFVFETRDFPLEAECGSGGGHGGACESAVAARLAKEKGKGREMETWLYTHQPELTRDRIKDAVREVAGVEDFDARYPEVMAKVREDAQLGTRLGVNGTPTFFLNGIRMSSSPRASYLAAAIEHLMEKSS